MRPDIRRDNLRTLISEFKTIAAVAEMSDTSEKYLSEVLRQKGNRSIGSKVAKKLEDGCGKPPGWMDIDHSDSVQEEGELTATEAELLRRYRAASPAKRRALLAVARL